MSDVKRYSSVHQIEEEKLSEHVTEVSAMSFLISLEMNKYGETIDLGSLLSKCLVHDVDEVITGDIPRNTKYASSEAKECLTKVAETSIRLISDQIGFDIYPLWSQAKDGKEGIILQVVDMLVVAKKAITEIEIRSNLSFLKVIIELDSHLKKRADSLKDSPLEFFEKSESVRLLYSLVEEARDEISSIRIKYSHIIDKYKLRENVINGD